MSQSTKPTEPNPQHPIEQWYDEDVLILTLMTVGKSVVVYVPPGIDYQPTKDRLETRLHKWIAGTSINKIRLNNQTFIEFHRTIPSFARLWQLPVMFLRDSDNQISAPEAT